MSDLIDRQVLKESIEKLYQCDWKVVRDTMFIAQAIDDLPSVEPEERTAKVETVEKPNVYKCSDCGQYFHSTAWGSPVEYCSRCGAKLDWGWT